MWSVQYVTYKGGARLVLVGAATRDEAIDLVKKSDMEWGQLVKTANQAGVVWLISSNDNEG